MEKKLYRNVNNECGHYLWKHAIIPETIIEMIITSGTSNDIISISAAVMSIFDISHISIPRLIITVNFGKQWIRSYEMLNTFGKDQFPELLDGYCELCYPDFVNRALMELETEKKEA